MIQLINTGTGGGGTVVIEPATPGVLDTQTDQLEPGTTNIPAGAYDVTVYNTGLVDITVAGETLYPNDAKRYESRLNHVNNVQDFTPAIAVVVPAGGSGYYVANYPSA